MLKSWSLFLWKKRSKASAGSKLLIQNQKKDTPKSVLKLIPRPVTRGRWLMISSERLIGWRICLMEWRMTRLCSSCAARRSRFWRFRWAGTVISIYCVRRLKRWKILSSTSTALRQSIAWAGLIRSFTLRLIRRNWSMITCPWKRSWKPWRREILPYQPDTWPLRRKSSIYAPVRNSRRQKKLKKWWSGPMTPATGWRSKMLPLLLRLLRMTVLLPEPTASVHWAWLWSKMNRPILLMWWTRFRSASRNSNRSCQKIWRLLLPMTFPIMSSVAWEC